LKNPLALLASVNKIKSSRNRFGGLPVTLALMRLNNNNNKQQQQRKENNDEKDNDHKRNRT
jgi:hypothetical protein